MKTIKTNKTIQTVFGNERTISRVLTDGERKKLSAARVRWALNAETWNTDNAETARANVDGIMRKHLIPGARAFGYRGECFAAAEWGTYAEIVRRMKGDGIAAVNLWGSKVVGGVANVAEGVIMGYGAFNVAVKICREWKTFADYVRATGIYSEKAAKMTAPKSLHAAAVIAATIAADTGLKASRVLNPHARAEYETIITKRARKAAAAARREVNRKNAELEKEARELEKNGDRATAADVRKLKTAAAA